MDKFLFFTGFALFLLLQSPSFIFALGSPNCKSIALPNQEECKSILALNITNEERALLISNLEYNNKFFPDHEYIFQKNSEIEINGAPQGTPIKNGIFIKNAWMSIFSVMPSILYKDNLYVPDNAEVLSGFNYELAIPSNYYGPGYPSTNSGDCKRIYSLIEDNAENKIYVDNNYQGEGDLVKVAISKDSEIKALYDIHAEVNIKHYKWNKYCSSRDKNGSCRRYSYRCSFSYEEIKKESIQTTDSVTVKHYKNNLFADIKILDSYNSAIKLLANYSNSIILEFSKSDYRFNEFVYSINYSKPPYYFLTLKADDYKEEVLNNLIKTGDEIIVSTFNDCNIKAYDFFNVLEKTCNSEYENVDFYIKTDRLKYGFNEKIKVDIYPKNVTALLKYGNEEKEATGSATFNAKFFQNKITAYYKGHSSEKVIFISNKERFLIVWNLIIFAILNYLFYKVIKNYRRHKQ